MYNATNSAPMRKSLQSRRKIFKAKMRLLQKTLKSRIRRVELINPVTNPRYDNIYLEGIRWLDEL